MDEVSFVSYLSTCLTTFLIEAFEVLTSCVGDVVDCGGAVSGTSPRTCLATVLAMCRGEDSSPSDVS